jgi:hypothetical protein
LTRRINVGVLADIQAITADSATLATDQGTLQGLQSQVTTLQAQIAGDSGTVTAADTQLSTDLQALPGPVFVTNPDGSVSVYAYSPAPPGFTIVNAVPAT